MSRCVVKIGSSLLTNPGEGLWRERLLEFVEMIATLQKTGREVILVSSGAVAAGYKLAGFEQRPDSVVGRQCAAAVGQGLLIQAYSEAFQKHGLTVAQVLLTRRDFSIRRSFENAHNTLSALLDRGVIPIINENDTVAVQELTFGDNDMLGALVAALLDAEDYIILTDIDGLYEKNPRTHPDAKRISQVTRITPEIIELASPTGSLAGTGGMRAKIKASELALTLGSRVFIGRATRENALDMILEGSGAGTYFGSPTQGTLRKKRKWIAFYAQPKATVRIDSGAEEALIRSGKSLLPVGVTGFEGTFRPGDVVEVLSSSGTLVGRGAVNYSSEILEQALGQNTNFLTEQLEVTKPELIHRDDWVCLLEHTAGVTDE